VYDVFVNVYSTLLNVNIHDESGGNPDSVNVIALTCTIIELEHYDNNIIEKNRYMESMQIAVYQIIEVFS
jgi:hypothetical protein